MRDRRDAVAYCLFVAFATVALVTIVRFPAAWHAGPDAPILTGLVLAFLYVLPTGIAYVRRKQNLIALATLNLAFGWLAVPWLVSLIWALLIDVRARRPLPIN